MNFCEHVHVCTKLRPLTPNPSNPMLALCLRLYWKCLSNIDLVKTWTDMPAMGWGYQMQTLRFVVVEYGSSARTRIQGIHSRLTEVVLQHDTGYVYTLACSSGTGSPRLLCTTIGC